MDAWEGKADVPTPRWGTGVCQVDGIIFVMGGWTQVRDRERGVTVVEAYNPETNKWTQRADMPTARGGCAVGVIDGKIYVVGGMAVL